MPDQNRDAIGGAASSRDKRKALGALRAQSRAMVEEFAITHWKDGTWQVWSLGDAMYAESDPDWSHTVRLSPTCGARPC